MIKTRFVCELREDEKLGAAYVTLKGWMLPTDQRLEELIATEKEKGVGLYAFDITELERMTSGARTALVALMNDTREVGGLLILVAEGSCMPERFKALAGMLGAEKRGVLQFALNMPEAAVMLRAHKESTSKAVTTSNRGK